MRKHINSAVKILNKIFADGTYSNMALYGEAVSDMTTKLVYGVLENNIKIEYILSQLIGKKPQNFVYVLLKVGVYALIDLSNVPNFAIVSECVEVAKMNGKAGASGFVNAVLKKVAKEEYHLPKEDDSNFLSVQYSKPQWFVDKMTEQYGVDATLDMLKGENSYCEHVRINSRASDCKDVEKALLKSGGKMSDVGGIVTSVTSDVKKLFSQGKITYQSPSSMLAVKALNPKDNAKILDLCSAPGGKAIYMSELCPQSTIIACDLHEHRVKLIEKYKTRMHAQNVKAIKNDATIFNESWQSAFDFVLVDAPCSCFGTYKKHPDVFLTRDFESVNEIANTQRKILENASKYVADNGVLLYSTCTLFREENSDVIEWFLKNNTNFTLEKIENLQRVDNGLYIQNNGCVQILPHGEYDGFFIARMRKNG